MSRSNRPDLMHGTLDLTVLQTLAAMGPQLAYRLARRTEQRRGGDVVLNQGTIYASLLIRSPLGPAVGRHWTRSGAGPLDHE